MLIYRRIDEGEVQPNPVRATTEQPEGLFFPDDETNRWSNVGQDRASVSDLGATDDPVAQLDERHGHGGGLGQSEDQPASEGFPGDDDLGMDDAPDSPVLSPYITASSASRFTQLQLPTQSSALGPTWRPDGTIGQVTARQEIYQLPSQRDPLRSPPTESVVINREAYVLPPELQSMYTATITPSGRTPLPRTPVDAVARRAVASGDQGAQLARQQEARYIHEEQLRRREQSVLQRERNLDARIIKEEVSLRKQEAHVTKMNAEYNIKQAASRSEIKRLQEMVVGVEQQTAELQKDKAYLRFQQMTPFDKLQASLQEFFDGEHIGDFGKAKTLFHKFDMAMMQRLTNQAGIAAGGSRNNDSEDMGDSDESSETEPDESGDTEATPRGPSLGGGSQMSASVAGDDVFAPTGTQSSMQTGQPRSDKRLRVIPDSNPSSTAGTPRRTKASKTHYGLTAAEANTPSVGIEGNRQLFREEAQQERERRALESPSGDPASSFEMGGLGQESPFFTPRAEVPTSSTVRQRSPLRQLDPLSGMRNVHRPSQPVRQPSPHQHGQITEIFGRGRRSDGTVEYLVAVHGVWEEGVQRVADRVRENAPGLLARYEELYGTGVERATYHSPPMDY